jgi:hypothetical protein
MTNDLLTLEWKCHTPRLIKELNNLSEDGLGVMSKPLVIFTRLLAAVATRCGEIDDPILNHLMCRLTLYEVADPDSPEYDAAVVKAVKEAAIAFKQTERPQA